jgi:hypothetical protein
MLLFSAGAAAPQEQGQTEEEKFDVCVFKFFDAAPQPESEKYSMIITDDLEVELKNIGLEIVAKEVWQEEQKRLQLDDEALVTGMNAISVAEKVGADLAISGFYRIEGRKIMLQIKCYNVKQRRLIAGVLENGRLGISLYNLISNAVASMQPKVAAGLKPQRRAEELPDTRIMEVELLSPDNGAEVYINGEELAGTIEAGSLRIYSVKSTRLHLEIRKEGFHTGRVVIPLEEKPRQRYELQPLKKRTRWASQIVYTSGQFLGFGLGMRYYFSPDGFFLSIEDYFYVQHDFESGSDPILHNDTRLLAGWYLILDQSSVVRLGLSSGLGIVISDFTVPEVSVATDIYINLLNASVELNFEDWIFFFRVEGKFGLDIGENLLGGQWYLVGDVVPPMSIGAVKKW